MRFEYPHEMMEFEWKRIYPWVAKAFEEIDNLFHLRSIEHEIAFTAEGTYIAQREKVSIFPYSFDKLPTIKKRYEEISSCFKPFVPPSISNSIAFICRRYSKPNDITNTIEDLKKLWLDGDKEFVIDFLDELVNENINDIEISPITYNLMERLYRAAA